ncbi:alpha/beta fold hydrolase [Nonomuraea sp. M3C6]|uniref:Alpha/beta fold hydrolase n=1 Tax=Nonomuraea marmarensis TaxID=3351344 RepID=A0ABW7A5M5_9ACTN
MLLLPGSGGWRLTFHAMVGVLAEQHTVYALDPPGQGKTAVTDPAFGHDVDAIAHAIGAFLDAVGLPEVAIIGHSWGGGFALRFAQLHPHRVSRLALLATRRLPRSDVPLVDPLPAGRPVRALGRTGTDAASITSARTLLSHLV